MILDIAKRRAELTPSADAVYWRDGWHDYAEMNARADRLAGLLAERGIGTGERVSILAHNDLAHLDLINATAKTGVIYTPMNVRLAAAETRDIVAYVRPSLLLVDAANHALASSLGVPVLPLEEYEEALTLAPTPPLPPDLDPEDTQMILFTGGTTGVPKGAMQPYRQSFYNAVNTVMSWGLRDDDRVIQATPAFHAAVNAFSVPLYHLGASVVWQKVFDPGDYLRLVRDTRPTILFLVPAMLKMVADHPDFAATDLSCVRWAISGGAPCPEPVRQAFLAHGVRFKQGYGLTEAGVNCFSMTLDEADIHPDSVGKAILHSEVMVRRPDGAPCPPGDLGELTIHGPHVFTGYFERPQATADVLKDGWLWTGDLARMSEEGFVEICGRRKEMFISGGENVFPSEIEAALYQHPGVSECSVIGVPDELWGEVGLAVVVPKPSGSLDVNDLIAFLRERLARYKVPKHILLADELPKSGAGKILKSRLRETFSPPPEASMAQRAAGHHDPSQHQAGLPDMEPPHTPDEGASAPESERDRPGTTAEHPPIERLATSGGAIAYQRAGSGTPVILVHGNFASKAWWSEQLAAPPDGLELFALDLPNFGDSEPLPGTIEIAAYASAVASFLDALALDHDHGHRPILVGHSLGGAVVQAVAVEHLDAVAGLMLVSAAPPAGFHTDESHYALLETLKGNADLMRQSLLPTTPTRTPPYFDDLIADALRMQPAAFSGNGRALERMDLRSRTASFSGPVLVLHGAKDVLISRGMAEATAAAYPHGQLVGWDDVGHSPQVENPRRFNQLLAAFAQEAA